MAEVSLLFFFKSDKMLQLKSFIPDKCAYFLDNIIAQYGGSSWSNPVCLIAKTNFKMGQFFFWRIGFSKLHKSIKR